MIVAVQREIEARGIPTVLITVVPNESKIMRPPRAVWPKANALGRVVGPPGDKDAQRRVLMEALFQFEVLRMPGEIVEI